MKMKNEDLKKITSIKQYLLDPPVSFKLKDYAITYLQDVIAILNAYPLAKDVIIFFENKQQLIQENNYTQNELIKTLKQAGVKLSNLNNK